MADRAAFSPQTFRFLSELTLNNSRGWFEQNKPRYEQFVREPALTLIRGFAPRLAKIAPHLVASDKKVGGSLLRVQRDVRFSADKSPFKTNIGIHFRHSVGKDVHAPGLYVHVSPEGCFVGCGVWRPDPHSLKAIREYMVGHDKAWQRLWADQTFLRHFRLGGESLSRPPQGFDPQHPLIGDLKRKDFIVSAELSQRQVTSAALTETLAQRLQVAKPFMKYLCAALAVPF